MTKDIWTGLAIAALGVAVLALDLYGKPLSTVPADLRRWRGIRRRDRAREVRRKYRPK